jgi:hypothetical protein
MRRERDVKAEVKKIFDRHKWFWFCPPANAYGKSGISDFLAIRDGIFMAVETKFDDQPTALQQGFLSSIAAETGFAFVVDEKRLVAFDQWMGLFDQAVGFAKDNMTPPVEIGGPLLDVQKILMRGY